MTRVLVYEPLSAGDPASTRALVAGSPAHADMLAAGRAMRDAIAGDLARIPGVRSTVASQQDAGHEAATDFVRRVAALHDLCWVVAPETNGLLLQLHEAAGAARWIGCGAAAIRTCASKRATCAVLHAAGILTPLAFARNHCGAWIVKPDDGAGSLATRRHPSRAAAEADLRRRRRSGHDAVLEPFIAGEGLSISLIAGPELARPVAFNRQRLDIDAAGWLHDLGVQAAALPPADPRAVILAALAAQVVAAVPGLRGFVGIDVVWNEGDGPVVIEVNPRVTCAYVGLSALLQRNLAAEILAQHAGLPAPELSAHASA